MKIWVSRDADTGMGELNMELLVSVCTGWMWVIHQWDMGRKRMPRTDEHVSLRVPLGGLCVSFQYPSCIMHLCGKTIGVDRTKVDDRVQRCSQWKRDGIRFKGRSYL
jgi:hypothetical protein